METRNLPTFPLVVRNRLLDIHNAEMLVKFAREGDDVTVRLRPGSTAGGDPRKLRGIPAIGPNCPGAINFTRPGVGRLFDEESHRTGHSSSLFDVDGNRTDGWQ